MRVERVTGASTCTASTRTIFSGIRSILDVLRCLIRLENWKYIWHSGAGREQLVHCSTLPKTYNEVRDLAGPQAYGTRLSELRSCLLDELTSRQERFVRIAGSSRPSTSRPFCHTSSPNL